MKKFLVVLVILTVALSGAFAEIVGGYPATDTLTFFGRIGLGDVIFTVEQTSSTKIDLANNENVQFGGAGVKIGEWVFAASSQPSNSQFEIEYDYDKIESDSTGQSFTFEVLETVVLGDDNYVDGSIEFSGNVAIKTDVLVKLTQEVGEDAEPANDFEGIITVTLTKI